MRSSKCFVTPLLASITSDGKQIRRGQSPSPALRRKPLIRWTHLTATLDRAPSGAQQIPAEPLTERPSLTTNVQAQPTIPLIKGDCNSVEGERFAFAITRPCILVLDRDVPLRALDKFSPKLVLSSWSFTSRYKLNRYSLVDPLKQFLNLRRSPRDELRELLW